MTIKKLEFVSRPFDGGSNRSLAILTGNGRVLFHDMETDTLTDEINCDEEIIKFSPSFDGKYVACNLSSGHVNVYHVTDRHLRHRAPSKKEPIKRSPKASDSKPIRRQIDRMLDRKKLTNILRLYGEYPENYRVVIWTQLLRLPKNLHLYRGINDLYASSFAEIDKEYPLQDKMALKNLKKLLNNLVSWCPFFNNVNYLPHLVFPFVKVFKNEPLLLFEAVCTVLGK